MYRSLVVLCLLAACGTSTTVGTTAFSNAGSSGAVGSGSTVGGIGAAANGSGSTGSTSASSSTTSTSASTSSSTATSGHTATASTGTSSASTATSSTASNSTATAAASTSSGTGTTASATATGTTTTTGSATSTGISSTSTTGAGSTTTGSSGASTTTIGTSTSGTVTGSTSSTSGTTGAIIYCNGVQLSDPTSATVYLATFPKADAIRAGCDLALDPYITPGAGLGALAGILDRNTYASAGTVYTVWPIDCADVDAGPQPTAGTTVTDGGTKVSAALAAGLSGTASIPGPVYGVVTFLSAPYTDATGAHSGMMWIQDEASTSGAPPPGSGVAIYFPKGSANDAGATAAGLYPAAGANLADVVALTNLTWSPYVSATDVGGLAESQFAFGATATMTVIGPGALPPPVPLTGAELSDAGTAYMGMRVLQTDGPDTVVDGCPVLLQSG